MAEFDRAALAAAAAGKQTQAGNGLFWGAVIALPVLGLVVGGLLFALPGKPKSPVQLSQTTAPATEQAETQTAETEPEPVWSPSSEMERYGTVRLAISMCNRHLDYSSFGNTQRAFYDRNESGFEPLQALRSAEWKAGAGEPRRDAQGQSNELMLKVKTRQHNIPRTVLDGA